MGNERKMEMEIEKLEALRGLVEQVDHPAHYNTGKIEVITVIEDWELGFHLGNAVKYIGRAGHKKDVIEDLKKAIWYINRKIDALKP